MKYWSIADIIPTKWHVLRTPRFKARVTWKETVLAKSREKEPT